MSGHRTLTDPTRRAVAREITAYLAAIDDEIEGWTSLAEGADAIFAWSVLAVGGRLVFVPPADDIEKDFEAVALTHFQAARTLAARTLPSAFTTRSEDAYFAAGQRIVDEVHEMLLVWNREPAVGRGGTGDIADYCDERGRPYEVVWPPGSSRP